MGVRGAERSREMAKGAKKSMEPAVRDTTINLHKKVMKVAMKKRAPRAVSEIKQYAAKAMSTKGVRNVPYRVRVRLARKRNDDEDADEKFYTLVQHVPVESYKGLLTETVQEE